MLYPFELRAHIRKPHSTYQKLYLADAFLLHSCAIGLLENGPPGPNPFSNLFHRGGLGEDDPCTLVARMQRISS